MTFRAYISSVGLVALFFFGAYSISLFTTPLVGAQNEATQVITGFGWSDTIGWISFDCSSGGSCTEGFYAVSVDADTGLVSGFAWSDNIGWISFNAGDLSNCPEVPCEARLRDGALIGWGRALAGGTPQSGGWDGFIRLSGTNPSYGPRLSGDTFSGYAWGSDVVGWVDLSYARLVVAACSDGVDNDNDGVADYPADPGCESRSSNDERDFEEPIQPAGTWSLEIRAEPRLVRPGGITSVVWEGSGVGACLVSGPGLSSNLLASSAEVVITRQSTFSISCRILVDGEPTGTVVTRSVLVNVVPAFEEI